MKSKFLFISLALGMSGCGMTELMEKTYKMTETIRSNCGCDDVRLLSYEENALGPQTAYFEIVGADIEKHTEIAIEINNSLRTTISNYCEIDDLTLDFINKGKHHKVSIKKCEIKE